MNDDIAGYFVVIMYGCIFLSLVIAAYMDTSKKENKKLEKIFSVTLFFGFIGVALVYGIIWSFISGGKAIFFGIILLIAFLFLGAIFYVSKDL